MSQPKKALSPEQVKQRLRMQGITTTKWAAAHGYTRNEVYRVLNGQAKAHYGKAHEIAVKLGMKQPETAQDDPDGTRDQATTRGGSGNPQRAAAA